MPIPSFNEILEVNKFERQDKQDVYFEKVED